MSESTESFHRPQSLVGVVSDTHGHLQNTQRAVRMLESLEVDTVLHCGDIGSPDIPPFFRTWPTHYVLGNVDWASVELQRAIEAAGGRLYGRFGQLALGSRQIAFLHGDDATRLEQEIGSQQWDLICHGHTHQANQYREGRTLVLNPGAIQRAWPPSIAVIDLRDMSVTPIPLE